MNNDVTTVVIDGTQCKAHRNPQNNQWYAEIGSYNNQQTYLLIDNNGLVTETRNDGSVWAMDANMGAIKIGQRETNVFNNMGQNNGGNTAYVGSNYGSNNNTGGIFNNNNNANINTSNLGSYNNNTSMGNNNLSTNGRRNKFHTKGSKGFSKVEKEEVKEEVIDLNSFTPVTDSEIEPVALGCEVSIEIKAEYKEYVRKGKDMIKELNINNDIKVLPDPEGSTNNEVILGDNDLVLNCIQQFSLLNTMLPAFIVSGGNEIPFYFEKKYIDSVKAVMGNRDIEDLSKVIYDKINDLGTTPSLKLFWSRVDEFFGSLITENILRFADIGDTRLPKISSYSKFKEAIAKHSEVYLENLNYVEDITNKQLEEAHIDVSDLELGELAICTINIVEDYLYLDDDDWLSVFDSIRSSLIDSTGQAESNTKYAITKKHHRNIYGVLNKNIDHTLVMVSKNLETIKISRNIYDTLTVSLGK
jgi:hypothetical protein